MDCIGITAKDIVCSAHVIGDDEIAALPDQFGLGVFHDLFRFGGESDHKPRAAFLE